MVFHIIAITKGPRVHGSGKCRREKRKPPITARKKRI
jgi:hypothetical protein